MLKVLQRLANSTLPQHQDKYRETSKHCQGNVTKVQTPLIISLEILNKCLNAILVQSSELL